ncbi:hypothetical protein HMPREF0649_00673 [Segatella buccae D17]|nr:hypothetical protein HMPREF0649_00673 [Segatella buccae D17]
MKCFCIAFSCITHLLPKGSGQASENKFASFAPFAEKNRAAE